VKAFEMIPHSKLLDAAHRHKYNIWLLRLSIGAYRLARSIGVDGVYSRIVFATRGITAGSCFATTELRVLLLDVIDEAMVICRSIKLQVYVDDMNISAIGPGVGPAAHTSMATDAIVNHLENKLLMTVSLTKSAVTASTATIARITAKLSVTGKLKVKRSTKLLGTAAAGGRRRSVRIMANRLATVKSRVRKFHVIRKMGVSVHTMARMAATPTITYGVDIMGMSDSMLQAARVTVATVAAPGAGGKTPDMILFALDSAGGTLDPAFDAIGLPIKHWSTAWWEGWVAHDDLASSIKYAAHKLQKANTSIWQLVTGPVAALVGSLWRIGWTILKPHLLVSDDGSLLDLTKDPPAAVCAEAKRSIHRWQFARVLKLHPHLVPPRPTVPHGIGVGICGHAACELPCFTPPTVVLTASLTARLPHSVIGIVQPIAKLILGKSSKVKTAVCWEGKFKPFLLSTLVGGQWTQSRVAKVQGEDTDNRCRLCLTEAGTLEHRHHCPATEPELGWPKPPHDVKEFIDGLSQSRGQFLKTRGVLAIHAPITAPAADGWCRWLKELPDIDMTNTVWFIDGSGIDGPSKITMRFGFGIAVATLEGDLIGYAYGAPPSWIRDVPGTEGWALHLVARMNHSLPRIITDCLGLVTMLGRGPEDATRACRPLARLWGMIFACTGTVVPAYSPEDKFIWMPSHCTLAAARFTLKSNGQPVSVLEWRGNRLVDLLAKAAARMNRVPQDVRSYIMAANRAVEYSAAMIGTTSWAANHSPYTTALPDGTVVTKLCRDSNPPPAAKVGIPTGTGKKRSTPTLGASSATPQVPTVAAPSKVPPTPKAIRVAASKAERIERELLQEARFQRTWHQDLAAKDLKPTTGPTGAERLAALRQRRRDRNKCSP